MMEWLHKQFGEADHNTKMQIASAILFLKERVMVEKVRRA
jgi:hypothetical protein